MLLESRFYRVGLHSQSELKKDEKMSVYEFQAKRNNGQLQSLSEYQDKVLLIVNTASSCGLTPQYEGLQALYKTYHEQGLEVLAFPCNQFGGQEARSNAEIKDFCDLTFNIGFPLFEKIDVNGEHTPPLFTYLKQAAPGILGSKSVKWNFTKFLVSREGKVLKRFAPNVKPKAMIRDIEKALNA